MVQQEDMLVELITDHTLADEIGLLPSVFKINATETLQKLLAQEDMDDDVQITILDKGPKVQLAKLLRQML